MNFMFQFEIHSHAETNNFIVSRVSISQLSDIEFLGTQKKPKIYFKHSET